MRIDQGGTLELADGGLAGSNLMQLGNIGATLRLDDNSTVPSALKWFGSGLAAGARIDLAAASDATAAVNGSTLSITPNGRSALDFMWSAPLTGLNPGVASDGSGGGAITVSGSVSWLLAGSSDGADFSATLAVTSDGTGIDTLGTTALDGQTITLTGTLNNYATAEWQSSAGTLSGTGTNLTLDLGLVYAGGPVVPVSIGVLTISDGSQTAAITFLGGKTAHLFHAAPDGHGGTLIAWHN